MRSPWDLCNETNHSIPIQRRFCALKLQFSLYFCISVVFGVDANRQNKTSAPGGLQNHAVQFIADCRLKSAYLLYRQLP